MSGKLICVGKVSSHRWMGRRQHRTSQWERWCHFIDKQDSVLSDWLICFCPADKCLLRTKWATLNVNLRLTPNYADHTKQASEYCKMGTPISGACRVTQPWTQSRNYQTLQKWEIALSSTIHSKVVAFQSPLHHHREILKFFKRRRKTAIFWLLKNTRERCCCCCALLWATP